MNILGIILSTNSTAALMKDGKIEACASEERFTRKKNTVRYPRNAIDYCLAASGLVPDELDTIALAGHLCGLDYYITDKDASFSIPDRIREQHDYWHPRLYENRSVSFLEVFRDKVRPELLPPSYASRSNDPDYSNGAWRNELLLEHLGENQASKIRPMHHHLSHLYYGVYSGADTARKQLVFCLEGFGDDANASVSVFDGGRFDVLYKTDQCYLGRLYRYITLLLGMKPNEHEFKVMGLSPYSKPYHSDRPFDIFNGTMYVNEQGEFDYRERPRDSYFYFRERLEGCRFDGIAQGLQRYTERILTDFTRKWIERTGIRSVVFTGGVAMNIKALMHVAEMTEVEKLWVGPSVADESLAIGACFHAALEKNPGSNVSLLENVYLGPECDAASIERLLSENGVSSRYTVLPAQGPREIAALLARGKVIGRVAGRMEFGARALGNRSILADPRSPSMIRVINDKIKNRDFWMPFAPAILEERAGDYLLNPKELRSPYMALSFHSTELARKHLAAALHPADFTLRPQIVEQRSNPGYHAILCEFEKATGVGGLLNTSFNLHGSPIVRTPRDAFDVFERTDLDALVLDGYVIVK